MKKIILLFFIMLFSSAIWADDYFAKIFKNHHSDKIMMNKHNIKNNDLKNFTNLLKYSQIPNKKDLYDEVKIYKFLSTRYSLVSHLKAPVIKISNEEEIITAHKLIEKYKKNHDLRNQTAFRNKVQLIWRTNKFNSVIEERHFVDNFSLILTREDYNIRLEKLLWMGESSAALRIFSKVNLLNRNKAKSRIEIQTSKSVEELFAKLNKLSHSEYDRQVLLYDAISWCKKNKMNNEISELLAIVPLKDRTHNDQWWNLIKIYLRDLIVNKNYSLAYKLASNHNIAVGKIEYVESEFFAGYVAFKFLNNKDLAEKHFLNSYKYAKQDFRKARAAYWLGTIYTGENSKKYFNLAGKNPTDFYGQMALSQSNNLESLKTHLVKIKQQDIDNTLKNPIFKYYYYSLLTKNHNLIRQIAKIVTLTSKSKAEVVILAGMANYFHMPDISFYIGNVAKNNLNMLALEALYPRPSYQHLKFNEVLSLAIIHRESNFSHQEISSANAYGLMQVMPSTGNEIAKQIGTHFNNQRLLDPQINVLFGNHFLKTLSKKWDGSNLLTIASYNAGAGSANKWVKTFGDPRNLTSQSDLLYWTESIPFKETRYYVQSVVSSMVIYNIIINRDKKITNPIELL